jgi:hypothetical protein
MAETKKPKDVHIDIDVDQDIEIDTDIKIILRKARELWDEILKLVKKRKKMATHLVVKEDPKGPDLEEGQMGKPLANTDVRRIYIVPKNDQDKKDKVQDGSMVATSRDESVATIKLVPENQLEADITPVDGASSAEVFFDFKADADLGEGVVEITGSYSCPIIDEMASILQVEEGADSPKAPTVTPHKKS